MDDNYKLFVTTVELNYWLETPLLDRPISANDTVHCKGDPNISVILVLVNYFGPGQNTTIYFYSAFREAWVDEYTSGDSSTFIYDLTYSKADK
jgi:hypothetical protein